MKIRWLWVFLGLSLALNVAFVGGFIYARFLAPQPPLAPATLPGEQPPSGGRGMVPAPQVFQELVRELELDEAQRRRLRQTFVELRRSAEPRFREQQALRDRLIAELGKPQADQAAIGQLLDRMALNRTAIQKDMLRQMTQFAAGLPPDKQERFRQFVLSRTLQQLGLPQQRPRRETPREGPSQPQLRDDRPPRQ